MEDVFLAGPLADSDLLREIGITQGVSIAVAQNMQLLGVDQPWLKPMFEKQVNGVLVSAVSAAQLLCLELFANNGQGFLSTMEVEQYGACKQVKCPISIAEKDGSAWSAADWKNKQKPSDRLIVADIALIAAAPTDHNTPIFRAGLQMRAWARLRAQANVIPTTLRHAHSADDVEIVKTSLPYARYFDTQDVTLKHRRFDGTMSQQMVRTALRAADAVTVLPYDPVSDRVVIVEQFRPAAFLRGDPNPWVLEPVAGRCDADESVEDVALREAQEEAGLTLLSLEPVASYYPSPGCLSEYIHSFVGLVDLASHQTGIHGLATENEDIRTHFLAFDQAMDLLKTGEADAGPLVTSLLWLSGNRTRLRGLTESA